MVGRDVVQDRPAAGFVCRRFIDATSASAPPAPMERCGNVDRPAVGEALGACGTTARRPPMLACARRVSPTGEAATSRCAAGTCRHRASVNLLHALSARVLAGEDDGASPVAAALPRSTSMAFARFGRDHAAWR